MVFVRYLAARGPYPGIRRSAFGRTENLMVLWPVDPRSGGGDLRQAMVKTAPNDPSINMLAGEGDQQIDSSLSGLVRYWANDA